MTTPARLQWDLRGVWPRLAVRDLARALRFYTDELGFQFREAWPTSVPGFATITLGGATMQLVSAGEHTAIAAEGVSLNFDVTEVVALHARLSVRLSIEWGPGIYRAGRREFALRDPDGYLLVFSEATDDPVTCEDAS